MTTLVTADWHLSSNPRDNYRREWLKKLPAVIVQKRVKLLLILGDLTEAKEDHEAELVNFIADQIGGLAKLCSVVISTGNHDWLSSPEHPYFEFLRHIPNVTWVKQPAKYIPPFPAFCGNVIILPHTPNYERDWEGIDFRDYTLAFAHQTFAGAAGDSGIKLSGIPLSYFPPKLQIISGDVHKPQSVGKQLIYVGSPYSIDFGDDAAWRALLLTEGGGITSLYFPGPQKRLVEVSSIEQLARIQELHKGDILKVRVGLPPDEFSSWPSLKEKVQDWAIKGGYQLDAVLPVTTIQSASMSKLSRKAPVRSDEELLRSYSKLRGVDEATTKAGLRLLQES